MISGSIVYKYRGKSFRYTVDAFDTSECFSFYITSGSYNAIAMMVSPNEEESEKYDALWERSVEVKLSKLTVKTGVTLNEAGKKVKDPVNSDMFCRLAALIRYVKTNCTVRNERGYTGLELASSDFEAIKRKVYDIPYPTDLSKLLATVTLEYGNIVALKLWHQDFDMDLEVTGDAERVFYRPKDGWASGFRLTSEYLGFPLPEQKVIKVSDDNLYHSLEEVMQAHPEKELAWLRDKNYIIVTDDTLEEICSYIMNWDGYVEYDTETSGLNINFMSRVGQADQCVGIILSVKYGESFFFPMQMKAIRNLCGGDHYYFMEHYAKPILEKKELVVHNLSFDWKVAYIYGINCNIVHDTMIMLQLTFGAEIKDYKVGLKENSKLLLGRDSLELSDLVVDNSWGESDIRFWDLPEELVKLYACADTDNTLGLLEYMTQNDILSKYNATKVYEIEVAFAYAVGYQEFFGHRIDVDDVDMLSKEVHEEIDIAKRKMVEICGHDFNPNSPIQLRTIMYDELKIPEQISRKTGKVTTDKETLKRLAEITDIEDNLKYPFCSYMLDLRKSEGVRKIVDKFPEYMTPDGYIFAHVMQLGTTTGRVSINTPNYQSYSDPIKKRVVPRPGFYMTDTDYSSIEYRVLANMVGNKNIMHSFEDPDFDYHTYQAAHMYGVPYAAVTKAMRKAAKGINFGIPYGMGDESLGVRVYGEESPENTRKAAGLRNAYFKGQEDIRDWFEANRDKGVNLGYTETYFNRRRYYRRSDFTESAIRRQAGNQIIQGCLDGSSKVQSLEYGIVAIEEVVGMHLHFWDGQDWTSGDVTYSGKKQKCIVHFKGGLDIVCSPEHLFMVVSHRGNERFVQCQCLSGCRGKSNRSGHRVRINQGYAPSLYKYNSEEFKDYVNIPSGANFYHLDDIGDSFKLGVFLGRLASDGNYSMNNTRNGVRLVVTESEYNILDELRSCIEAFGYSVSVQDRVDRNEQLTWLNISSRSLTNELCELDVRHTIDDRFFMDTELLRGYLRGFIDGDGGISGKAIVITWGDHYDFEPMVLAMQKALLFFGIRSRYRHYAGDRYVLQIKTNDNERFLEVIGFMNENKQMKAKSLEVVEDEHIFGKCLMVDYVEMTDEYVDMYDVCNTDRGYYVADGVITHNSAADLYKLAVGNIFKRICKEGWLGKVLFPGFIHDELLAEVSNEINPGVWLKVLREEFEVHVFNDDGSPWCPLYMGFGYGMSWYEAKSVELPIKLQWELETKYGVDGFPDWDGDGRAFCDKLPDILRDFEVRDIRNQILEPENQGKEIKPALNTQIIDCLKEDAKEYEKYIARYIQETGGYKSDVVSLSERLKASEEDICEYLDQHCHIQCLYHDADGNFVDKFSPSKSTQEMLDQYCILHGVDRSKVNLLDIPEFDASTSNSFDTDAFDETDADDDSLQRIRDTRIDTLGMYLDVDERIVTLLIVPPQYMSFIQQRVNREGKGYRVFFKDTFGLQNPNMLGGLYSTECYLTSDMVQTIQQMYLQYFKTR